MEFYEANPDGFTVAQPGDLPSGLEWVTGAELEEFAGQAKRGGTFMEYTSDYPRTFVLWGRTPMGRFGLYARLQRGVSGDARMAMGIILAWQRNGPMGQTGARCFSGSILMRVIRMASRSK